MSVAATFRRWAGVEQSTDYIVLVTDGQEFAPRPVVAITGYNEGLVMRYRNGKGKLDVVYIPHSYRPLRHKGKYYIGKRLGNNSACRVIDGQRYQRADDILGPPTDKDCPGEDLSSLIRADGVALGFKALYERNIPWKLIIILGVGVVVIIGVVVFVAQRFL